MNRGDIGLVLLVAAIFGVSFFVIAPAVDRHNKAYEHEQSVQVCKAEQYDAYQYVVKLGANRWSAACSIMVDTGGLDGARKAEKQCFIQLKACG